MHHILYSKTHRTYTHQLLSCSNLRLCVQNCLMEENQLIHFTSLLCLSDQSSSFLALPVQRDWDNSCIKAAANPTLSGQISHLPSFMPQIKCQDSSNKPKSASTHSASKFLCGDHTQVLSTYRQNWKAPHGCGFVLPDTLSKMHNPHLLRIGKMRNSGKANNTLHMLMNLQWLPLPTSERNPKHKAKVNISTSQVSWVHPHPYTALAAPLHLAWTWISHRPSSSTIKSTLNLSQIMCNFAFYIQQFSDY